MASGVCINIREAGIKNRVLQKEKTLRFVGSFLIFNFQNRVLIKNQVYFFIQKLPEKNDPLHEYDQKRWLFIVKMP